MKSSDPLLLADGNLHWSREAILFVSLSVLVSRWGWSFLSTFLFISYDSNTVKNSPLGLLHVNVAFEGYQWPLINSFSNGSKLREISYK